MNKKTLILLVFAIPFLTIGAGCAMQDAAIDTATVKTENNEQNTITYLISNEDTTKYCNGVDMDSNGYRKTITTEKTTTTPNNLTEAELAKFTVSAATTGMCQTIMKQTDFTVDLDSGTVDLPQFDGYAGVSIMKCYCVPQVEVNLLRMPNIKQVIWEQNN